MQEDNAMNSFHKDKTSGEAVQPHNQEEELVSVPRSSSGNTGVGHTTPDIDGLISQLASREFAMRRHAIEELVRIGKPAVPALVEGLSNADSQLRWRLAKILVDIADPRAAPALVACLEDEDAGTRWVMAEALIALKRDSLAPLLEALIERTHSFGLQESAHHVLYELAKDELGELVQPVLRGLEGPAPEETVPVAAAKALEKMNSETS